MTAHARVEATWLHMCEWRLRGCTCASGGYVAAHVRVEARGCTCASGGYVAAHVRVEAT